MGYVDVGFDKFEAWDGEKSFELVDKGDYLFRVTKAEMKKSQSSGGNTLYYEAEVVQTADGGATPEAGKGVKMWQSIETDVGKRRVKCFVEACDRVNGSGFDPDSLVDAEFVATVVHQSYDKPKPDGTITTYTNARLTKERRPA